MPQRAGTCTGAGRGAAQEPYINHLLEVAVTKCRKACAVRASTGRRLLADRSRNGNGTSNKSPRSNIVPNFILDVVPHRRERACLRAHQIAPAAPLASFAQKADEIEHLARSGSGIALTCS
jgi:hypothetical protein